MSEQGDSEAAAPLYVYESKVHCANVLLSMDEQRQRGILCDVTVLVEGREVRAHRAVLAASSRYFLQALLGNDGSTGDAEPIITLPDKVGNSGNSYAKIKQNINPAHFDYGNIKTDNCIRQKKAKSRSNWEVSERQTWGSKEL